MPCAELQREAGLKRLRLQRTLSASFSDSRRVAQAGPRVDIASAKVAGFTELRFLAMIFLHSNYVCFCLSILHGEAFEFAK